jgi:hypothetical protein
VGYLPGGAGYTQIKLEDVEDVRGVGGDGRVKIDDEVREVHPLDAIRVAPASMRAFEAGPSSSSFRAASQR